MTTTVDLTENNSGPLVGAAITFLACSWLSVSLRVYTRVFLTRSMQLDDWLMILGQVGNSPSPPLPSLPRPELYFLSIFNSSFFSC